MLKTWQALTLLAINILAAKKDSTLVLSLTITTQQNKHCMFLAQILFLILILELFILEIHP